MRRTFKKRLGCILLTLCMVLTMLPATATAAGAQYSYIDENGESKTVEIDSANVIDKDWDYEVNILTAGWYVVTETVTVGTGGYSLAVDGDAHLILSDGVTLTAEYGLYIRSGSLSVYGQSGGTGCLTSDAVTTAYNNGSLAIYGGAVTVTSTTNGIHLGRDLTVQNGSLAVTGTSAIVADNVTIGGGEVTAGSTRSESPGYYGIYAKYTLTVSGGTVTATGGEYGLNSYSNTIVIDGGSVDATVNAQPKNSQDALVYQTTLLLSEAGPNASVSGTVSNADYYDFSGVKTDGAGRAYLWLPAGEQTVSLTAGDYPEPYAGTFAVGIDNLTCWPLKERTVTFDPKGGTMATLTAKTDGATLKLSALPAAPTRTGYTFDGWYSAYYGGDMITTDTVFELDATVYARWKVAGEEITADTWDIDVSKLSVNHTEPSTASPVWSYSAFDKILTVPASDGTLTLTGENDNLQVKVTGGAVTLVLSDADISAGGRDSVRFEGTKTSGDILELADGTANILAGRLYSDRELTLKKSGSLTVTHTRAYYYEAPITLSQSNLVIDGPTVTSTGDYFGLNMGSGDTLEIKSGSLTLDKTDGHYNHTLEADNNDPLAVNVRAGAALTIRNGGTMTETTVTNNGGTVYIDGDVAGTAVNDDSGGSFTVTGALANYTGTITKPVLHDVAIDLSALAAGGTEYYELVDGSTISHPFLSFDGYTVIRIKQPAKFTLTQAAPSKVVLLDMNSTSEYILNNVSIDGLAYYTLNVTVTGTNHIGSFAIPIAGNVGKTCRYSGSGTLKIQNTDHLDPDGAFPLSEYGTPVIDGCSVEISGFAEVSNYIRVKSGNFKADGAIHSMNMEGGSADVRYLSDHETSVDYTGGELTLIGTVYETSTEPDGSLTFVSNGGSAMPSLYLYGINRVDRLPENPVKSGYVFGGWYKDSELTNAWDSSIDTVTGNITLYAKWTSSGGGGGGGGGSYAPPAAAGGTAPVTYTATNGMAALSLPTAKVSELIEKAEDGAAVIDLSKASGVTAAELPKAALTALANAELAVTVNLPAGTITLDANAAASVAKQAAGSDLSVELKPLPSSALTAAQKEAVKPLDLVLDINILSADKKISTFDGLLTVSVPYTGPQPAAVWYLNDKGELEKLPGTFENGAVTFTLDHLSLYVVGQDTVLANPFTDVKEADWFNGAVQYVYENGLMKGTDDTAFGPHGATTRGMIVTILYRLEHSPAVGGKSPFSDVAAGMYYADAAAWAAENKLVTGYGDGKFGPEDAITREQLAAILMNYAKLKGYDITARADLSRFADAAAVSGYAKDAMSWANAAGLIQGDGASLTPAGSAERAQVAAILQRFLTAQK